MECPMAKRLKLDEGNGSNSTDSDDMKFTGDDIDMLDNESSLETKLRQFDVLDEVQGDESGSEGSGNFIRNKTIK